MIKELLKPLEWQETEIDGERFSWVAKSALHDYQILYDHIGKEYAAFYYERITKDRGSKRSKSVDELKQWAEQVHYPSKMAKWLEPDPLTETVNWFKEAKPEPTHNDIATQIGCHYEEVSEMARPLCDYDVAKHLSKASDKYKAKDMEYMNHVGFLSNVTKTELLDSLADQIATAVGVAYMMNFDIIGALTEVNASNWSKFVDGKAVTDENGKIIKGSDYFKPQLEKYLGGSND